MKVDQYMGDYISLRGNKIALGEIFSRDLEDDNFIAELRAQYMQGDALRHVGIQGLFSEKLLDLIVEEMQAGDTGLSPITLKTQKTLRVSGDRRFGPATTAYFWAVNSNPFVTFLQKVTGIENLIVDHSLYAGGLHETPVGGFYAIHRDFNLHRHNRLSNSLVLLTYLNRDWRDEYGGHLELWDAPTRRSVKSIRPDFGMTVVMAHGPSNYHGHPAPLACPEGMTRKSIAAYYYTHNLAACEDATFIDSVFLDKIKANDPHIISRNQQMWASLEAWQKWGMLLDLFVPPILLRAYRHTKRKVLGKKPR